MGSDAQIGITKIVTYRIDGGEIVRRIWHIKIQPAMTRRDLPARYPERHRNRQ